MIRRLRGKVIEFDLGSVVLDVSGVGYHIYTNAGTILEGAEMEFYTYLAIRENAHDLFGFLNKEELTLFELLIELPKIGPKTALQILSKTDIKLIKEAVINEDPSYLSKLSGIGKKVAEKIVAGLKDKLEGVGEAIPYALNGRSVATHATDAVDALVTLGYQQMEARKVILQIGEEHPELKSSAEALKLALKLLSK